MIWVSDLMKIPAFRALCEDAARDIFPRGGHGCRAEPHCLCGHNAWYHEDDEPGRCGMEGCPCLAWRRCHQWERS